MTVLRDGGHGGVRALVIQLMWDLKVGFRLIFENLTTKYNCKSNLMTPN